MSSQSDSRDAMIASIRQAGNAMGQGWMGMLAALSGTVLPGGASWAADPAAWSARLSADSKRLAPQFAPEFGTPQFLAIQTAYAERQGALWKSLLARETGAAAPAEGAATVPDRSDKRFKAAEWHQNPYYDYLRQSYLLASDYCNELVEAVEAEPKAKERLRFTVRQWIDASCPANFPATNPEALQKAIETGGESLSKGLANMLADAGKGQISQTDETAFEVGRNLAISPGAVVYENELIQLIQYAPATKTVARRPLVIVPPCINKFYILDLQPENSFVGYAVGEGHTVFMVSWRNVKADLGHFTWDDYVDKGVIEALRVAREIAASDKVNALGFCVGGTLLAAALAVLKARAEPVVESVTYLTSLLDFSDTGQIGCLVDEQATQAREQSIGAGGILPGSELTSVFSALRANDLIWPYVVSNYLKGESPVAFDLLFWNADTTNLPGPMYCWYLRNMYLENRLREPGALRVCGVPVDLGGIGLPSFIYGSREDHIVPWKSTYQSIGLLGGEVTYVLGASGHIAGVVNPPAKRKRSHWVSRGGAATSHPTEPQEWFAQAIEHPGSWWPVWSNWLLAHRGGERKVAKTRKWGNKRHKAIEPAPGRYVKEKFNS